MKTYKQIIAEAKKVSIDINWASEIKGLDKKLGKKYGIKIKDDDNMHADVTGDPKKILKFLRSADYDMDMEDIEDLYPELLEGFVNEEKEVTLKVDFDIGKKDKKNWKALGIKAVVKYDAVQSLTGTKEALIKYYTKISGWRKEDVIDQYPELK